jgi:hypothetical protein
MTSPATVADQHNHSSQHPQASVAIDRGNAFEHIVSTALTHGFRLAFYVLAAIALRGAVLAAALIRDATQMPQPEPVHHTQTVILEAA